jgi:hypothetical protein
VAASGAGDMHAAAAAAAMPAMSASRSLAASCYRTNANRHTC